MAQEQRLSVTLPPGRLVQGSLYAPNTTDMQGNPLVYKTGANAGKTGRVEYYFAVAIPKAGEGHWANTVWGQKIWAEGHKAFPQAAQLPTFKWKIEDGDDQSPNPLRQNRRNCDNEGFKGCWIVKLKSGTAPKIWVIEGNGYRPEATADFIKPGYWLEAQITVDGNNNQTQPGLFMNHNMVCFRGYDKEIVFGPNVNEAGFGQAPLPAGVSATPLASSTPPPAPPANAGYAAPPTPVQQVAPVPVTPNPGFVQLPPPPQAPSAGYVAQSSPQAASSPAGAYAASATSPSNAVPPPPPSGPVYRMTAAAQGVTREAYHAAGWTDELLIAHGYMTA